MSIPGASTVEVPVLIVGAGPAGLALSVALSRYGIGHLLVERHRDTAHTPRAHIINQRTIEIFRHLGISDRFHAVATPQHLMANNVWVTTLAGLEVARSETWGTSAERAADYRMASPEPMANCPQTVLEPMLLGAARDTGADIRFGWEFISLAPDQGGVTSVVRERDGQATLTVRSQYVIGADGARSRVLGQAGLTVEGPDDLARAANIWFRADLSRYLAHRPGVLTWNVMPGPLPPLRLGTMICHKPFTEFVLAFMYDPAEVALDALGTDELNRRIRAFVGEDGEDVDAEILGVAGWQVRAQIAPRLFGRTRVLHGRCGSPAPADQRPRAQYVHRGRVQPRLEARSGPGRPGGRRAAGQLLRRATARRGAGRPARHHQPAGRSRGRGRPRVRTGTA
jgi:2,4-dichlorophenol 6-monooxygenase